MTYYLGLVERGAAFGVVFPDCPGCTAMDDVVENGVQALREWMADRVSAGIAPPEARTLAALRADASLAEDFAAESLDTITTARPA